MERIMPIPSSGHSIDLEKRLAMIKGLPCFSMLSAKEADELTELATEKHFKPDENIVIENDLVDCVYIIVSGQAEVTHQIVKKKKLLKIPVAILTRGESIGLNDTGFFSSTGKRTATVTAVSEMTALSITLKDLHNFLQIHPHLQTAMYATASQMLRVKLIKQSLPFHRLSHERSMWLANQVEEITVPAGTIIFNQGDEGDRCYLIRSGQVEITATDENGVEQQLAILTPPTLFGEATLITRSPRNATARAIENCELFILPHVHLSELIETEDNVANMFMSLMVDRSRPVQNPNVSMHPRTTVDGQPIVILKNPDNGSYFKLSDQGEFIWQQLDGRQTMQDVTLSLAEQFNVFAPDVVAALISKLARAKFVENLDVDEDVAYHAQPIWIRAMLRIRKLLEARIAIGDADKWITKTYNSFVRYLFTRIGQIMLGLLAVLGVIGFADTTPHILTLFKTIPNMWWLLILLIPFTILSTALHELGHAFATKAFGYEVHYMGVGWYWISPVAFVDTSDMWLSTRWPRTVVNLAGVYTDILNAGIATLLIFVIPNSYVQAFLWIYALYAYINAFRMLSPLQELDGYYVLMDLLERPQLRKSAVIWLVKDFPKALRHPRLFRQNWPEVCYWLACIVFLMLVTLLTLLIQSFVFKILGIHSSNPFVSLALPFFVVIVSSLNVIADIRSQV
jgi:putative peptide zinc metalloprotease protein